MARIIEPHLALVGLWANQNPYTQAPEGALSVADECVVRCKDQVGPRPGFKLGTEVEALTSVEQLLPYRGAVLHIGSGATKTYWPPGTHVLSESGGELPWNRDEIRGVEARKNLYLTTSNAIRKLTSATDADAELCGLIPPTINYVATSGTGGFVIAQNQAVAYVAVLERTDPNGMLVTSAPSGRGVVQRTIAGVGNVAVSYAWGNARAGDVIKVYRSLLLNSTAVQAVPSNQYYLCRTITLAASSGTANFTDKVAEADLGQALYTNDGEPGGGATRGNYRPPRAGALALYKDSLIFANLTNPPRIQLRWLEGGALATVAAGIGTRSYTGTKTATSADITSMSSTVGLKVGMILRDATGFAGTGPVVITAIVGTTVTVSAVFGGSTGAATVVFCDAIKIGTEYHRADTAPILIESLLSGFATTLGRTFASTKAFGIGIGTTSFETAGSSVPGSREVLIESILAVNGTTLTIAATHGDEYEPALPEPTATALNLDSQVLQNVVGWSKTGQPEHFVLQDYSFVGGAQSPILAIFTAGDSVWMLKAKGEGGGVYRLSGAGELSGFRVDHVDVSTWLLHGSLACAQGDAVYAWTNKGLVGIDEGGIVPISKQALGELYPSMSLLAHTQSGPGSFAVANSKDDEIVIGIPGGDFTVAIEALVLNTRTKAFARWFVAGAKSFTCACYDPSTQLLMFGQADSGAPAVERDCNDALLYSDQEHAIVVTYEFMPLGVPEDLIAIEPGSGWTPEVGDAVLLSDSAWAIVTEVFETEPEDPPQFMIARPAGQDPLEAGPTTACKAFACGVGFGGPKSPGLSKRFRELITHWARASGVRDWTLRTSAARQAAGHGQTDSYQFGFAGGRNHRAFFPPETATGTAWGALVTVKQAGAHWAINGYTVVYDTLSTRVDACP